MRDFEEDFILSSFACCHQNKIFIIRAFSAACGIKLWVKADMEGWGIIYGILKRSVTFSVIHNEKRGINVHTKSASMRVAACWPLKPFSLTNFSWKKKFTCLFLVERLMFLPINEQAILTYLLSTFFIIYPMKNIFHAQMPSR